MSNYPGLKRRGQRGIYQLRLAIPRDLRPILRRNEITISLRTSDPQKAVDRYFVEVAKIRAAFNECRNDPAGGFFFMVDVNKDIVQPAPPTTSISNYSSRKLTTGPLLSKAIEAWFSSLETRKWRANTARDTRVALNHFIKARGDRPLGSYEKQDAREFKLLVQDLPPRWNLLKIFKGMPLVDVAKSARTGHVQTGKQHSPSKLGLCRCLLQVGREELRRSSTRSGSDLLDSEGRQCQNRA